MTLRNAFANVATEDTLGDIKVDKVTREREILEAILTQLKIMNLHLSLMNDEELTSEDLAQEENL